ncbi:S1/P1 nuclease [Roseateles chitinivorans]|uniref:S1/P1 nuclease n=1 Tax=Roseateles chitinivorans TaxID=2917965 RepID=UPI003D6669D3
MTLRTTARGMCGLISISALVFASGAHAYSHDGHQAIGAIADALLKGTPTEAAVKDILKDYPDLRTVAVWADCVKSVDLQTLQYVPQAKYSQWCAVFEPRKAWMESFVASNSKGCRHASAPPAAARGACHNEFHYTDISNLRRDYDVRYPGAAPRDVVHAINAAIAVLRGQASPSPFNIADRQQALALLVHYVGDLHQPLHAVAIYLDKDGLIADPELQADIDAIDTSGGGRIGLPGAPSLHTFWDDVPLQMNATGAMFPTLVADARWVPRTSGDVMTWSRQWASETIQVGASALEGLSYTPAPTGKSGWQAKFVDENGYVARSEALKRQELTRAGARLAQLLHAVLGSRAVKAGTPHAPMPGYLPVEAGLPDVRSWIPAPPDALGLLQLVDDKVFESTRPLLATARGRSAAEDDVWNADQVLDRFLPSLGTPALSPRARKAIESIITTFEYDASNLVAPMKKSLADGGRARPFVARPGSATCLSPVDMAGHADDDLVTYGLAGSGSYPSTHSTVGLLTGMLLAELFPTRATEVIARGLEFGQSRVVCGFHYQSDVDAGRIAAAGLMARLRSQEKFRQAVEEAQAALR